MAEEEFELRLKALEEQAEKLERQVRLSRPDSLIPLLATRFDVQDAILPPSVFAYHSSTVIINDDSGTVLAFNTEEFDTDTMHNTVTNNTRITFNTTGTYVVSGASSWSANPVNAYIKFLKNGTVDLILSQIVEDYRSMSLTTIRDFVVGDYLELVVFQNSGGDLTTLATAGKYSTFAAVWVAP